MYILRKGPKWVQCLLAERGPGYHIVAGRVLSMNSTSGHFKNLIIHPSYSGKWFIQYYIEVTHLGVSLMSKKDIYASLSGNLLAFF